MASHLYHSLPVTLPKKKGTRAKRRADGDTATSISQVQKCSKNILVDEEPSQLHELEPRRSGRSGAGSGGRVDQLEKLGSVLEAPIRKLKKVTDIPEGTVDNPLAPEKPRRGRGAKKFNPPPPYPAVVAETSGPSSAPTAPPPGFYQSPSDSQRFGFFVPPGTEPDLPALDNPHYADTQARMAESQRSQASSRAPSRSLSRQPSMLDVRDPVSPQLLYGISRARPSISREASSGATDPPIDPLLVTNPSMSPALPKSQTSQLHNRQGAASDASMSTDKGSSESGEDGDKTSGDDNSDSDAEGWGATRRRETAHPGFSRERRTTVPVSRAPPALETEFEFDFSRDEGDNAAQQALQEPDTRPVEIQRGQIANDDIVDVLVAHHGRNGRAVPPHPDRLAALSSNATNQVQVNIPRADGLPSTRSNVPANATNQGQLNSTESRSRAPRNSKKSKDDPVSPDTLAFYPPVWKDLLEDAKRGCRVTHLVKNPFPSKSRNLRTTVLEGLTSTVVDWTRNGVSLEPGYWPEQRLSMGSLLLADISTWRSELKSVAATIAPSAYGLIAPADAEDRTQWTKSKAAGLLDQSLFLRDGIDENGKTRNFGHPALNQVIKEFFYVGSYRVADKSPDIFRHTVPVPCLALAAAALNCVLDGFAQKGTGRSIPQFSGKLYSSVYRGLLAMIDQVLEHPYHGPRLQGQLSRWGKEGWAALQDIDTYVERHDHLTVILD